MTTDLIMRVDVRTTTTTTSCLGTYHGHTYKKLLGVKQKTQQGVSDLKGFLHNKLVQGQGKDPALLHLQYHSSVR